jgi:hypothetical protein
MYLLLKLADARSVVVTQPNNKLSRVLKALLKEVPAALEAINSASLAASLAMADAAALSASPDAVDAAVRLMQQRLQLMQQLQVCVWKAAGAVRLGVEGWSTLANFVEWSSGHFH